MQIAQPSCQSLFLETFGRSEYGVEVPLGTATGFVVRHESGDYLISNYHVICGRHPDTGQAIDQKSGLTTAVINLQYPFQGPGGEILWQRDILQPVDNATGMAAWYEHPVHGRKVDVVALPLALVPPGQLFQYQMPDAEPRLRALPADGASIIGFPFGKARGDIYATWVRGFIASEPTMDVGGMPKFLIDSRTRPGQSGSPVIQWFPAGDLVPLADGSLASYETPRSELLGVYSGRIHRDSDIGIVWKASVIKEIIEGGRPGQADL